ncbi:MAG: hypothetical protein AMS27_02615 [Bacteroides sp. SM23_62_1]|nr:MAG: hypothetical protein AMS27_02615 [Bacteroides sp. SM23_62_1]
MSSKDYSIFIFSFISNALSYRHFAVKISNMAIPTDLKNFVGRLPVSVCPRINFPIVTSKS